MMEWRDAKVLLKSIYERSAGGKTIRLSKSELEALFQAYKACDTMHPHQPGD